MQLALLLRVLAVCGTTVEVVSPARFFRKVNHLYQCVAEAFHHIDKPYDYDFDFNVSTRIVCTELIYRCFNDRGSIVFTVIKRLGRFTLSGDDIMNQWLGSLDSSEKDSTAGFDLVTLVLKMEHGRAEFFEGPQAFDALQRIQGGWRPAKQ
jgi:hypothetical protein